MIIDGVEVLYTMRNGKIVDPNIPMNGLVCCLDTRGKHNTDVYRNTLLDLSGNGNHGTLQNFNFTESSGYSVGGLNFDGIDDRIDIYKNTSLNDFTVYCSLDRDLIKSNKLIFQFLTTTDSDYSNFVLEFYRAHITCITSHRGQGTYEYVSNYGFTQGINNVAVRRKGSSVDIFTATKTVNYTLQKNILKIKEFQFIQKMQESESLDTLKKMMIYNRALTDTEITQLMEG